MSAVPNFGARESYLMSGSLIELDYAIRELTLRGSFQSNMSAVSGTVTSAEFSGLGIGFDTIDFLVTGLNFTFDAEYYADIENGCSASSCSTS
jgi:hypothetical protein